MAQLRQELNEALRYDDEPKAIQRMAELRDVLDELESRQGQDLDPPWPHFQWCRRRRQGRLRCNRH